MTKEEEMFTKSDGSHKEFTAGEVIKHVLDTHTREKDPEALKAAAIDALEDVVGKGLSEKKFASIVSVLNTKRSINDIYFYLYNLVLKSGGLGVI